MKSRRLSAPVWEKFSPFVYFQHRKINVLLKLARTCCNQEPVAEQDNQSINTGFNSDCSPILKPVLSWFHGDWYTCYKTKYFCISDTLILQIWSDKKHTNLLMYEIMYADMFFLIFQVEHSTSVTTSRKAYIYFSQLPSECELW